MTPLSARLRGRQSPGAGGPAPEKPGAARARAWALREPDEPLRLAAVTFCRNEKVFLPRWVRYYGDQLGAEHLYVVDDNSDDGSTDDLPCDVLRIPEVRAGKFNSTRLSFVSHLSRALLELYDAVLFCDTDEFVVPDPAHYSGLRDYVARKSEDPEVLAIGAWGLNVLHVGACEPPLHPDRPLLGQRRIAKMLPIMCKPSIKWTGASWAAGTHGVKAPYEIDPDLWMFHFKFADRALLQESADHRAEMVAADGRSQGTSWRRGGGEMIELLEEITAPVHDVDEVKEFEPWPSAERRGRLVVEAPEGTWRTPRGSQVEQMRQRPLRRVPERFHGIV